MDYKHSCGAHVYYPDTYEIEWVLTKTDDCIIELTSTNAVVVNLRLNTTPEDFFKNNMADAFINNMAAFLGISMDRIRIVNVRRGSAIVDFTVDAENSND